MVPCATENKYVKSRSKGIYGKAKEKIQKKLQKKLQIKDALYSYFTSRQVLYILELYIFSI
jgi:hypothetical protein